MRFVYSRVYHVCHPGQLEERQFLSPGDEILITHLKPRGKELLVEQLNVGTTSGWAIKARMREESQKIMVFVTSHPYPRSERRWWRPALRTKVRYKTDDAEPYIQIIPDSDR